MIGNKSQERGTGAEQTRAGRPEVLPLAADPNSAGRGSWKPVVKPPGRAPHRGLFSLQSFFTVVIFSIFVITFVVQAFQIPTSSMENTLLVGDFLLVTSCISPVYRARTGSFPTPGSAAEISLSF